MKTKLFLMLLALNGLLLGASSASATPTSQNVASLSHTISNLVDLDADAQSLVESAIHRALLAKSIRDDQDIKIGQQNILIAGNFSIEDFEARSKNPGLEPKVIGQVAIPKPKPIINGRIASPHPKPPIDKKPPVLINGIIYNPNQQPQRR